MEKFSIKSRFAILIFKFSRFTFFFKKTKVIAPTLTLLFLMVSQLSFATTKTWIGGTGGSKNWTTSSNWSPSGQPTGGDDVLFNTAGTITFTTLPTSRSFNSLTINAGNITLGGTTITFTVGGASGVDFTVASDATLTTNNANITLANSATATIAGTYNTGARIFNTNGTSVVTTVTGTLINLGTVTCATASKLLFQSGSTYEHRLNGGTVPTSTWNANSTCLITGTTSTTPTVSTFNQSFGNFTWNCASQTVAVNLSGNLRTINGDFNIISTGSSGTLQLANAGTISINIAGDYAQSGGTIYLGGAAGSTTNIAVLGNYSLSGGTCNFSSTSGVTPLTLSGNFSQTGGTITETSTGNGSVIFTATTHTYTKTTGTIANTINFTVNSNGTLNMGTSEISGTGAFTLNSGAHLISAHADGLSGNIQSSGTKTFNPAANYTFNGTSAQNTGTIFPTTVNNLTFNNSAGVTINRTGETTVTGILNLTLGIVDASDGIAVTNTSTSAVVGGTALTFINGTLKWTLPANLTSGSTYNYPIGKGTTYLPISLVNPTTGSGTVTAKLAATLNNPGGTNGTGISAKSATEYWTLTTSGNYTNSSVSITRQSAISPYNVIASSGSQTGTYANRNGIANTYGIQHSDVTTDKFFVFATSSNPLLNVSQTVLYDFSYPFGNGPSSEQSFNVSGATLSGNVTVTPSSTNFEISTESGGVFQTTPITLTRDGSNNVSAAIYVRLKSGQALGNYNNYLTISTSGVTSKTVNLYGSVTPALTVSGGGSICEGSSINLTSSSGTTLSNQYWTGPNSFYSLQSNPTISSATTAMSGTYTFHGSSTSGTNLLSNGEFTSGNTGFYSAYTYKTDIAGVYNEVWNEGTYAVTTLPYNVHSSFNSVQDHTNNSPSSSRLQMIINGSTTSGTVVWGTGTSSGLASIAVTPYTNYQFSYWLQSALNDAAPSMLQFYANGSVAGPVYTANPNSGVWTQFVYNWYSGSASSVTLSLINQQTEAGGNDFAIDDMRFEQVYTSTASTEVSVVPTSTPASVAVSASANPVNAGSNVTFTATPTNGGTAPTYQWSVNGTPVSGATNSTYSYIPSNGDIVTCTMTSNSACYYGGAVSNSVTMTVNTVVNYWVGTVSTDWGNAANWSAGYVPGTGDNVIFASVSNGYGSNAVNDLMLDQDRTVGDLTNETTNNKGLIIPTAKLLVVNNTLTTSGNPNQILIKASSSSVNGSLIFTNPQLNTNVQATVEMYAKGYKGTPVTWTGGDGLLYTISYAWQYFGLPVQTADASPTFDGSWVRKYNENINGGSYYQKWVQLDNSSTLTPFTGYEITQNSARLISMQGALNVSNATLNLTVTSGYGAGYNIFGNSYTAAIDISKIQFPTSGVEKTVYLYNTTSLSQWGGGSSYTAIPYNTSQIIGNEIPSMQGFLLIAETPSTVTIPYSSTNNSLTKNTTQQRVSPKSDVEQKEDAISFIKIEVNGEKDHDKTWIFDVESTSRQFDNGWDGYKLVGSQGMSIYSNEAIGKMEVNTLSKIDSVYLDFKASDEEQYTLKIKSKNIIDKYGDLLFTDLLTGTTVEINTDSISYNFIATNKDAAQKRFLISGSKKNDIYENPFKITNSQGNIYVNNMSLENGQLYIYDTLGRILTTYNCNPETTTSIPYQLTKGVYITKIVTEKRKEYNQKIIIQ